MFEGRTVFEDIMGHYRYEKADVTYAKLSFSSKVYLQNNDFIKLKKKAEKIKVNLGKDFFIYTPMKIHENKDIIKKLNLSKK